MIFALLEAVFTAFLLFIAKIISTIHGSLPGVARRRQEAEMQADAWRLEGRCYECGGEIPPNLKKDGRCQIDYDLDDPA